MSVTLAILLAAIFGEGGTCNNTCMDPQDPDDCAYCCPGPSTCCQCCKENWFGTNGEWCRAYCHDIHSQECLGAPPP